MCLEEFYNSAGGGVCVTDPLSAQGVSQRAEEAVSRQTMLDTVRHTQKSVG